MRIEVIKRIAALVLLGSFFLPLSQCTYPAKSGNSVPGETSDISGVSAYPWPSVEATVSAALFGWPALVQLLAFGLPHLRSNRWLFPVEVALAVLTIAGITWLASWGQTMRYGAFIAYAAILAYLASAIAGRRSR